MKKGIAIFLTVIFGFAGGVSAESLFGDEGYWPTQEEYEAAMVIVQRYHQRQRQLNTELEGEEIAFDDEDYVSIPPDDQEEKSVPLRAVSSPPVAVFGNGEIEGSSLTAITADGVDGSVWIGHPDTTNQEQSGRLVFSENLYNYREGSGLCGFEFVHDGNANTLTLQGICHSTTTPYPWSRSIAETEILSCWKEA